MDTTSETDDRPRRRLRGAHRRCRRAALVELVTGAAALVWRLLRSGPKPSRATYPCQPIARTRTPQPDLRLSVTRAARHPPDAAIILA